MTTTINADNGVSSGSAGLKSSADSSGVLQLQTNGTAAVTVDTSQNVGIGTASPGAKLEVAGGISTGTTNNYVRVNQAYLSSGGDYVMLANNTWFNGSAWTSTANGGLYQITGQSHVWYTQTSGAFTSVASITPAGLFQFNSGYGSAATAYGCRAWVSFAGATGTRTGSGNVSSVTRNSAGNYTVNFASALVDAAYAPVVTTRNGSIAGLSQGTLTTSAFTFLCQNVGGTATDSTDNGVAVFR